MVTEAAKRLNPETSRQTLKKAFFFSCMGFFLQFLLISFFTGALGIDTTGSLVEFNSERYVTALVRWDSNWYMSIAEGYTSSLPPRRMELRGSNVAFFPGYPLFIWIVSQIPLLDLGMRVSTLVVSHFFAFVSWYMFFLCLFTIKELNRFETIVLGSLYISFPTAYYSLAGYSESLFIASMLSFVYFSSKSGKLNTLLAALSGFLMVFTRIVGIGVALALLISDFIQSLEIRLKEKKQVYLSSPKASSLLMLLAAITGAGVFFLYCFIRWGAWDLYFQTEIIGWGITPRWDALIALETWFPNSLLPPIQPNDVSGYLVPWFLWGVLFAFLSTVILRKSLPRIAVTCISASLCLLLFSIVGCFSIQYMAMSRYLYPIWLLLVIGSFGFAAPVSSLIAARGKIGSLLSKGFPYILLFFIIVCLIYQLIFLMAFASGEWVA